MHSKYRPDLEEPDTRPHIQRLEKRRNVELSASPLRRRHGRARDNLMLHAPTAPVGGIPSAKPERKIHPFRKKFHLPGFRPENSIVTERNVTG